MSTEPFGRTSKDQDFGHGEPAPVTSFSIGSQVSTYEIERLLGEGGFGSVYLARDREAGDRVALKVMRHGTSRPAIRRFENEAALLATLDIDGLVEVYEYGVENSTPFIVMEYVEGQTLEELASEALSHEPSRLDDYFNLVRSIIVQASRILHDLHEAGIIHRDLKPRNMILDHHGKLWIIDLGVANETDRSEDLARTGEQAGTAEYMAPEQVHGRRVDERTDIYGLGATLYFLLTGKPPFACETRVNTLFSVVEDDVEPPSSVLPQVPTALEVACLRCLSKPPEHRFQSGADVMLALDWSNRSINPHRLLSARVREFIFIARWGLENLTPKNRGDSQSSDAVVRILKHGRELTMSLPWQLNLTRLPEGCFLAEMLTTWDGLIECAQGQSTTTCFDSIETFLESAAGLISNLEVVSSFTFESETKKSRLGDSAMTSQNSDPDADSSSNNPGSRPVEIGNESINYLLTSAGDWPMSEATATAPLSGFEGLDARSDYRYPGFEIDAEGTWSGVPTSESSKIRIDMLKESPPRPEDWPLSRARKRSGVLQRLASQKRKPWLLVRASNAFTRELDAFVDAVAGRPPPGSKAPPPKARLLKGILAMLACVVCVAVAAFSTNRWLSNQRDRVRLSEIRQEWRRHGDYGGAEARLKSLGQNPRSAIAAEAEALKLELRKAFEQDLGKVESLIDSRDLDQAMREVKNLRRRSRGWSRTTEVDALDAKIFLSHERLVAEACDAAKRALRGGRPAVALEHLREVPNLGSAPSHRTLEKWRRRALGEIHRRQQRDLVSSSLQKVQRDLANRDLASAGRILGSIDPKSLSADLDARWHQANEEHRSLTQFYSRLRPTLLVGKRISLRGHRGEIRSVRRGFAKVSLAGGRTITKHVLNLPAETLAQLYLKSFKDTPTGDQFLSLAYFYLYEGLLEEARAKAAEATVHGARSRGFSARLESARNKKRRTRQE